MQFIINSSYLQTNTNAYPFYPSNVFWGWDNSSNRNQCVVSYTFNTDCIISNAGGDASSLNGYHSVGSTFQIRKTTNFGTGSSSKSPTLSLNRKESYTMCCKEIRTC